MARKAIEAPTLRALFAESGNQCAFPGCSHVLIDEDNDFVAQVCHISAANEGGERYDPEMSDDDRRSFENLVLFCYRHHIKTNDVTQYPAKKLKNIKSDHEAKWASAYYSAPETIIKKIQADEENFRLKIEESNADWRDQIEVAMEVTFGEDPAEDVVEIENCLHFIENLLSNIDRFLTRMPKISDESFNAIESHVGEFQGYPYRDHPFANVLWEARVIGGSNSIQTIRNRLVALHLRTEYLRLQRHPSDSKIRENVDILKNQLARLAVTASATD